MASQYKRALTGEGIKRNFSPAPLEVYCFYCGSHFVDVRKAHSYKYIPTCGECKKQHILKRVKLKAILYLGGKCSRCGYSKSRVALDFHHIDPSQKEFTIGGKHGEWETIRREIDKCVLLCANCHREEHYCDW